MCFVFIEPFNSSSRYSITVYLFPCFFLHRFFFFAEDFNVMCLFFFQSSVLQSSISRSQFSELDFQISFFKCNVFAFQMTLNQRASNDVPFHVCFNKWCSLNQRDII